MPQFMLLLHEDLSGWQTLSPEEMQQAIEKYIAWTRKPFFLDGKRLAEEPGRVMRNAGGVIRATDGPYSETKEVLGGYYIIEAAGYDDAVELSRDHPHLEFGGTIEVRLISET